MTKIMIGLVLVSFAAATNAACDESKEFKCKSGECIDKSWKCDGYPGCGWKKDRKGGDEDEIGCDGFKLNDNDWTIAWKGEKFRFHKDGALGKMIGEHCWDDCKRLHTQSCTEVTVIRNREGKKEEVKVKLLLNKANGLGIGKKSNNAKQGDWLDKDAIQEVTSCVKGGGSMG